MKELYEFFGNLGGAACFVIGAVALGATFVFSLALKFSRLRALPLGRVTAAAALICGLLYYFSALCTDDALYAPAGAAVIIAAGGLLAALSAVAGAFAKTDKQAGVSAPASEHQPEPAEPQPEPDVSPAPEENEPEPQAEVAFLAEDLPETGEDEVISATPLSVIELPQSAVPEVSYDEVIARAGECTESGISLDEAKKLVNAISKLKLLPENAAYARRRALMEAQQTIVMSVRRQKEDKE